MNKEQKSRLLQNQPYLSAEIMSLSESDIVELMQEEQKGKGRINYLMRCYGRLSILRKKREKSLLLSGKLPPIKSSEQRSQDEIEVFNSLKEELNGKMRTDTINALYSAYYKARRVREEIQLKNLSIFI